MRRRFVALVGIFFLTAALGAGPPIERKSLNPGFNFAGIEAFWAIVDILESDREPSIAEWDRFFEAPGYKRLTDGEFSRSYFQNALRAVFMPSRTGLERKLIEDYRERGGFLSWYTPLVLEGFHAAGRDREWLSARVEELKSYPYLDKAAELALEYLPEDRAEVYPEVDFIVFSDSRGYSPLIIGLTGRDELEPDQLECLKRRGFDHHRPFVLHMAHESFHMYRALRREIAMPEEDHPDYPVMWILDQMTNEGIGDLINRKRLYHGNGCLSGTEDAARMRREQQSQPAVLRIMDAFLSELADDPGLVDSLGRSLRGFIPQSGHPSGFFMADLIEEEFGSEAVVGVARDPFRFFALYNRAASRNRNAPVFSKKALAYLGRLERRYGL